MRFSFLGSFLLEKAAAHIWLDSNWIVCFVLHILHGHKFHKSQCLINVSPSTRHNSRQESAMLPSLHQFNCWCISFSLPSCPLELDVDPLLITLFYNMVTVGKHFCPLWCFRVFPWTVNACVQAQADFLSTWGEEQLAWWPTSSALWLAQMWFVNGDGLRKLAHSLALVQTPCGSFVHGT